MSSELQQILENNYVSYMVLKIFIDSDDKELIEKYNIYINERNHKMTKDPYHIDAGFDLFTPEDMMLTPYTKKVDYKIICSAKMQYNTPINKTQNTGFYLYPRSSISKTCWRLANSVGIIDAGYRGHLMGVFNSITDISSPQVEKFDRIVQICAPGLVPIMAVIVGSITELGEETTRGEGGFGSTGL